MRFFSIIAALLFGSSIVSAQCPDMVTVDENRLLFFFSSVPGPLPSSFTFKGNDYPIHQIGSSVWFNTDPGEVDVENIPGLSTIHIGEAVLTINYPGQTSGCTYDNGIYIGPGLPVEYSSFEANLKGQDVLIDWTTQSEEFNAGFEIQQSYDGVAFQTIGSANGTGYSDTPQEYTFVDKGVRIRALGDYSYYRLVQIDFDGKKSYSEVLAVDLELDYEKFEITKITGWGADEPVLRIYYYAPAIMSKINFLLSDINGNIISRQSIHPEPGLNLIEVDLNGYDQTLFFFSLNNGREVIGKKVAFGLR